MCAAFKWLKNKKYFSVYVCVYVCISIHVEL